LNKSAKIYIFYYFETLFYYLNEAERKAEIQLAKMEFNSQDIDFWIIRNNQKSFVIIRQKEKCSLLLLDFEMSGSNKPKEKLISHSSDIW